jgi:hypothetical protein
MDELAEAVNTLANMVHVLMRDKDVMQTKLNIEVGRVHHLELQMEKLKVHYETKT